MKKITDFFYFKSLKYGVGTILFALIPITVTIFFVEILIDIKPYNAQLQTIEIASSYNLTSLIYYVVMGVVHVIVCFIIANQFYSSAKEAVIAKKMKAIRIVRFVLLLSVFLLVFILDRIQIDLSYLSHERLYILLSKSEYFHTVFSYFPLNLKWFHLFSIFPFLLICMALAVMIYSGFYIGSEIYTFIDTSDFVPEKLKSNILNLQRLLRNYAQLLSIVMVSSTMSTILFFQLPVSLIKDLSVRSDYNNVSLSMGICWGVIFSLTLLFLCIYPYRLAHKKITLLIQSERVRNDKNLEEWIIKHKSYYSFMWNLKLLASIVSPAAAGILTTVISHIL